jgi:hypothetical protein
MFKSKRFLVLGVCMIIFIVGIILKADPISLGTGLTILTAPYLAAETIRGSNPEVK